MLKALCRILTGRANAAVSARAARVEPLERRGIIVAEDGRLRVRDLPLLPDPADRRAGRRRGGGNHHARKEDQSQGAAKRSGHGGLRGVGAWGCIAARI